MSADDGVALRQLENGKWIGQRFFHSDEMLPDIKPGTIEYPSLEEATAAWREVASGSEYGFTILWYYAGTSVQQDGEPDDSQQQYPKVKDEGSYLEKDLQALLNGYSQENASGTPDFILADYLLKCLRLYEETIQARDAWRGIKTEFTPWTDKEGMEKWEPINVLDIYPGMYVRALRDHETGMVQGRVHHRINNQIFFTETGAYYVQGPGWTYEVRVS